VSHFLVLLQRWVKTLITESATQSEPGDGRGYTKNWGKARGEESDRPLSEAIRKIQDKASGGGRLGWRRGGHTYQYKKGGVCAE